MLDKIKGIYVGTFYVLALVVSLFAIVASVFGPIYLWGTLGYGEWVFLIWLVVPLSIAGFSALVDKWIKSA